MSSLDRLPHSFHAVGINGRLDLSLPRCTSCCPTNCPCSTWSRSCIARFANENVDSPTLLLSIVYTNQTNTFIRYFFLLFEHGSRFRACMSLTSCNLIFLLFLIISKRHLLFACVTQIPACANFPELFLLRNLFLRVFMLD